MVRLPSFFTHPGICCGSLIVVVGNARLEGMTDDIKMSMRYLKLTTWNIQLRHDQTQRVTNT
jgi:hypothetical protein